MIVAHKGIGHFVKQFSFAAIISASVTSCVHDKAGTQSGVVQHTADAIERLSLTPIYPFSSKVQMGDLVLTPSECVVAQSSTLPTRWVERIPLSYFKDAMKEAGAQQIALSPRPAGREIAPGTGVTALPVAAFPAFSSSSNIGGAIGAALKAGGVLGPEAGIGGQKGESVSLSVDSVTELQIPEIQFINAVNKYLKEHPLNLQLLGVIAEGPTGDDTKCTGETGPHYRLYVINHIFYAKTITFEYGENTAVAAQIRAAISNTLAAGATRPPAAPGGGAPITGAPSGSPGEAANKVAAPLSSFTDNRTPGVSASFGYGESGGVTLKKTYDVPLAFAVGSFYPVDLQGSQMITTNSKTSPLVRGRPVVLFH